jgi:hypothetical protein
VFPGSVHPSGEAIEWDCEGEPAVVEPDRLVANLECIFDEVCRLNRVVRHSSKQHDSTFNQSAPARVIERARRYLAKLPPAVSGQCGHNATFHAACVLALGFGLDRNDAMALLRVWNETCQPPWTDKELEHKVDDALKQPGWRGYLLARSDDPTQRPQSSGMVAIARATRHALSHRRRALQGMQR